MPVGQPAGRSSRARSMSAGRRDPHECLACLISALAPGSYLAVSHLTADHQRAAAVAAIAGACAGSRYLHLRSRAEVTRFRPYDDLGMLPPYEGTDLGCSTPACRAQKPRTPPTMIPPGGGRGSPGSRPASARRPAWPRSLRSLAAAGRAPDAGIGCPCLGCAAAQARRWNGHHADRPSTCGTIGVPMLGGDSPDGRDPCLLDVAIIQGQAAPPVISSRASQIPHSAG